MRRILVLGAGVLGVSLAGVFEGCESGGDRRPRSSWSEGTSVMVDG